MSSVTDFISEIVRAANQSDRLTEFEFRRLTSRGVVTIREMRLETGVRPGRKPDVLRDIEVRCLMAETGDADDRKGVLLEIADMIRTLKIVLDAKDEVLKG
jgi:hypothetical protein